MKVQLRGRNRRGSGPSVDQKKVREEKGAVHSSRNVGGSKRIRQGSGIYSAYSLSYVKGGGRTRCIGRKFIPQKDDQPEMNSGIR